MRALASAAVAILTVGLAAAAAPGQPPATTRTDLQRHDLSAPGREGLQARIDFPPGAVAPPHSHPGEEFAYVLRGRLEYVVGGRRSILKTGDTLFIPAGTIHSARNVGPGPATELATYFVEKGRPLIIPAPK